MKKSEIATEYFKNSFNCSQSVLAAFAPEMGVSAESCMKIACAFGGGMGRQQLTCGAVTAALMVLGLKYGKGLNDENSKKMKTYEMSIAFMNEFKMNHKSINCRELLNGLDMISDSQKINELQLFETLCPKLVANAVVIAEKLLQEKP